MGEEVGDFDRVVAGVQTLDVGFAENDFAAGGVIGCGAGNESGGYIVAVVKKFDCAPCPDGIASGKNNACEGFCDFGIVENCGDAVFAEEAIAHFEDDDVGIGFGKLVYEGFSEGGGVGLLGCDDAEIGEDEGFGGSGVLHGEDVAAEADSGGFSGGDGEPTSYQLLDNGEAGFGFSGIHTGAEYGDDRRDFGC